MAYSKLTSFRPSSRRQRGRYRLPRPKPYILHKLLGAYACALAACAVSAIVAGPLAIIVYVTAGILLTRYVGRRVIWWPHANNVENVYRVKIRSILAWPKEFGQFIWKLAISRLL